MEERAFQSQDPSWRIRPYAQIRIAVYPVDMPVLNSGLEGSRKIDTPWYGALCCYTQLTESYRAKHVMNSEQNGPSAKFVLQWISGQLYNPREYAERVKKRNYFFDTWEYIDSLQVLENALFIVLPYVGNHLNA